MNKTQKFAASFVAVAAVSVVLFTKANADSAIESQAGVTSPATQVAVVTASAQVATSYVLQETTPIEVAYLGYN